MAELAVTIRNLGKCFSVNEDRYRRSLSDRLMGLITARFRNPEARGRVYNEPQTVWAVRDVSFDVHRGEVVGIIGRNGAGKSTLMKILARITPPTEGVATLYGRVGALLEVGTGFHPDLTGRENIFLNGAIMGMTRNEIRRRLDQIVMFSEVEQFIDTPVKHYSSGMFMRLAFSVAAHLDADVMLVDEVLAVGDIPFQRKCLDKIRDIVRSGRTVIFISHAMQSISQLCDRCVVMHQGRVVEQGDVAACIAAYERICGTDMAASD